MAIKDQCSRCTYYDGYRCQKTSIPPLYDQRSCENYNKQGIDLSKGSSNSQATSDSNTTTNNSSGCSGNNNNASSSSSNYTGNNYGGGSSSSSARRQSSFFDSLFSFYGRSRRTRYWLTGFFCWGIMFTSIIMGIILTDGSDAGAALGYLLGVVPCLIISFANNTKRLHDLGHNGLVQLCLFIPILNIGVAIYMCFFEGERHDNQYGPSPY